MKNIALLPGVLGFGRLGMINYFNEVAPHLEAAFPNQVRVRAFTTDPLGTVADRAGRVAEQITAHFGGEPVHLFAHSMGGLDARFLVSQHQTIVAGQVKSITAIGTPHNGSPVATTLNGVNPLDRLSQIASLLRLDDSMLRELKTKLNALHDLSETSAKNFNTACPDQAGVAYHEVVGLSRDGLVHTSTPFLLPFAIVHSLEGRNDGVVPVTSAVRPGRPPLESWPADHADMVGHDLDGGPNAKPSFDYLAAYRRLVEKVVLPARE